MANPITSQGTKVEIAAKPATGSPTTFTVIGGVKSVSGLGSGQAAVIDTTTLTSTRKEKRKGLADEGQMTLAINWDEDDAGQALLTEARNSPDVYVLKITLSNGTTKTFDALVLSFGLDLAVDAIADSSASIEITGEIVTA
jgi:hypothetical protein